MSDRSKTDDGSPTPGETEGVKQEERPRQGNYNKRRFNKKRTPTTNNTPFKGGISEIRDYTFEYADVKNRNKKWIQAKEKFIQYAGSKYSVDEELSFRNKKLTIVTSTEPTKPTGDKVDEYEKAIYYMKMKRHDIREGQVTVNLTTLYGKLWTQCDETMQSKIRSNSRFKEVSGKGDAIGLMGIIEEICEGGGQTRYYPLQKLLAVINLLTYKQGEETSLAKYLEEFETLVTIAERTGIKLVDHELLEWTLERTDVTEARGKAWKDLDESVKLTIAEEAKEILFSTLFLRNSNHNRYGAFKEDCHNSLIKGQDVYPKTIADAHSAMEEYKPPRTASNAHKHQGRNRHYGHTFATSGDQTNGSDAEENNRARTPREPYHCYNCGRKNACIAPTCPHDTREDGSPTRNALRKETGANMVIDGHVEGESTNDAWDDDFDEAEYAFNFNTNGITSGSKEIVVENLQGKTKHAFNQCQGRLNPYWILLDNCSTVHIFYNHKFLRNIRTVSKELHLYTNAGKVIVTEMGDLPGFGPVWYHPEGIANVLSFNGVSQMEGYRVEYQNWVEDAFNVTSANGITRKFTPSSKGLYYWDSEQQVREAARNKRTATVLVETVAENKTHYSHQDIKRAERARELQHVAGHLSESQLLRVARKNQLKNSPVTPRDVQIMKAIFGPSVPGLKGRTVRKKKAGVGMEIIPLPKSIRNHYQEVVLAIDVMHVNRIPFLTTLSRHIHYATATPIKNMEIDTMGKVLMDLVNFYRIRNFKVVQVMADGQFERLQEGIAEKHIKLNMTSRDEHVPDIERLHRLIKERGRATYHSTPFKRLPKRMVAEMILGVVFYINGFPWEKGISKNISPMTIVTGRQLDYNRHCKIGFGTYAQVRQETDNTMKERTIGAIAMRPNQNEQGGMLFYNLNTGRLLDRSSNDFTPLPMPDHVITRIEDIAQKNDDGITFTDRDEEAFESDDETVTDSEDESDPEESESDTESEAETIEGEVIEDEDETNDDHNDADEDVDNNTDRDEEDRQDEPGIETATGVDELPNETGNTGVETQDDQDSSEESEDEEEVNRSSYGRILNPGRSQRPMTDAFQYTQTTGVFDSNGFQSADTILVMECNSEEIENVTKGLTAVESYSQRDQTVNSYVLTQYNLKAGLKKFGKEGKAATTKELKQMLSREVFEEIEFHLLTVEDKRNALPILLFLTMKRDGTVKGRACADGRKQKIWMNKADSASPTVAIEALFYTFMIDALEKRFVATCDLPGHFLQTEMEGRVILRIDGDLALLLVELDPGRWKKHLRYSRQKKPVIYVKCSKAIYGTINAALLSYRKLVGHLEEWGYTMNPYDPCCWNKMINGKQMTVVFHVDDMKLSHVEESAVEGLIKQLESVYAKTDPMTKNRSKVHQYLGMTIDYRNDGEVWITMYDYIKKMIDELPEEMKGKKMTAAPEHLFKTSDKDAEKLNDEQKELFHHLTAKTLHLCKRARPDLQLATGFMCTRVKDPDEHDWKKLSHLMKYLQETAHMPLILKSNGKETSLYIDGAHAVHADMKGHAGVFVTEGKGAVYASSTKNKLNTTSSTETEIVSVGEKLPKHIWFRYFRIAQGGNSGEDVLYQDNESAMLLENNGRMSCGKGSKHINIRYFFVTDRIKKKEIAVRYCPTEEMIADYFTKPLQGALFRKFRDMVLGISEIDNNKYKDAYTKTLREFGLYEDPSTEST